MEEGIKKNKLTEEDILTLVEAGYKNLQNLEMKLKFVSRGKIKLVICKKKEEMWLVINKE